MIIYNTKDKINKSNNVQNNVIFLSLVFLSVKYFRTIYVVECSNLVNKKKRESRSLANNTIPVLCMYYIYKRIYSDIYKNIFTAPSRLNTDIKHIDIKSE